MSHSGSKLLAARHRYKEKKAIVWAIKPITLVVMFLPLVAACRHSEFPRDEEEEEKLPEERTMDTALIKAP